VSLDDDRAKSFATTWGPWAVAWDGRNSPADVPPHAVADNCCDDDGVDVLNSGGGFRFGGTELGLSVNRSHPDPQGRTHPVGSVISKRDEYLKPEDGLTLQVRVQVLPPTRIDPDNGHAGFVIYYRNGAGTVYGLHIATDAVRGGGYGRWEHQGPARPFNATDGIHIYQMVIPGAGPEWSCYLDGKHAFDAVGNSYQVTSLHADDKHPTIIIGGEKGNRTTRYERMTYRYTPGAYPPRSVMPAPPVRKPPPLPPPPPRECCWNDAVVHCYPAHLERPVLPFVFKSARPAYNTYLTSLNPPVTNKGDYTVGWDLTVDAECEPRGFSSYIRDGMGTLGILWSPDKVELSVGVKNVGYYTDIPIGIRRFNLDATQRHTYRIVRPANSFYAHLYIDGNPTPALYDQHLDASMGNFFDAGPPSLLWGDTLNNWGRGYVTIHDLRWSNSAFAPG
jgi:hypothetical protein